MRAIVNARLHPVSDSVIPDGVLLIDEEGKIAQVGADVQVPEGAEVINADGRDVTPGIIESHCHAGVSEEGIGWEGSDGNESTHPVTPQVRAIDGANPEDKAFAAFRAAGVTAAQIMPGSANIIGGEQFTVKSREAAVIEDMVIKHPSGMKAALGENPKRVYGGKKGPSTRMGNASVMRKWLQKAKEYAEKMDTAEEPSDEPDFDMKMQALLPVIRREMPLRIHCHRADDIATAVRIAEEFDIKFTLEHVTQGDRVLDLLEEKEVYCAVGPCMVAEAKVEMRGNDFDTAAQMYEKGIHFCITNDHPVVHGRFLRAAAGLLCAWDVPTRHALKSVTLAAAEHIGVDDRIGSLEPGKDADLVIWSGDPLDARTFADCTFVDGEVVFERE